MYNYNTTLWQHNSEHYFRELELKLKRQKGPQCVAASLAILTQSEPEKFSGKINTQNPVSWSKALEEWGMKLAYCPSDLRKLKHYIPELVELDDLFTLSYYTPSAPSSIFQEPDQNGWVCSSHMVVLHRDKVLDPMGGSITPAHNHSCLENYTKRIFRVFPSSYPGGL